jgi:hypothetical protein
MYILFIKSNFKEGGGRLNNTLIKFEYSIEFLADQRLLIHPPPPRYNIILKMNNGSFAG